MAKKKQGKNKVDNELDFEDLDGMEDDLDFGELEDIDDNRTPSKAEVSKELLKEAGTGFLDSAVKKTAAKALPEEYENNYYEAMEYADFAKETFDTNKSKVNKSLYKLGKEVKKIIPFQSKMLDGFLEKYESDFEEFKSQSEEQIREAGIQSNISSIFDKQLEIQKAFEAKRSAEDEVDKKQQLGINKVNLDVLTSIDSNIGNQTAFTLQISKEYYKKSLELQYKSFYVQADMLKTMRDYYKGFSLQFDEVVKNTGLPDFVKLQTSERVSEIMRTQLIQNTYKNVFDNNEYIKSLKQNFSNLIQEKVSSVTDALDNTTDALGGINQAGEMGGGPGRLMASIAAGLGGSTLGEKLADKISPKIKDKIKDNEYLNAGASGLETLATSPSTLIAYLKEKAGMKAEEYSDEGSPLRMLASKLFGGSADMLNAVDPGMKEYKVQKKGLLTHNQPAIFDNNVHRSITETIPMFLSKILHENANLRQSYEYVNAEKIGMLDSPKEQVYNYQDRKLDTIDDYRKSVEGEVFKDTNKEAAKMKNFAGSIGSEAADVLGKDKANKDDVKLLKNKKNKTIFENYLLKAGEKIDAKDFTYESVVTNYDQNEILQNLINNDPNAKELKRYLEILKKSELNKSITNLDEKMLDTKRVYPIVPVKELFKGVSKIAEANTSNTIDDGFADKLAQALLSYITGGETEDDSAGEEDISSTNIASGKCFVYLSTEDAVKNEDKLLRIMGEVKSINASGNVRKEYDLLRLLAAVNRTLKDANNNDPAAFQSFYDLMPGLQGTGKLGRRNLVEGKLGKAEDRTNLVDPDYLKNLSRESGRDIRKLSEEKGKNNIIDIMSAGVLGKLIGDGNKIKEQFKKDMTEGRGLGGLRKSFKNAVSGIIELSKETAKEAYKAASGTMSKLDDAINKAMNSAAPVAHESIKKAVADLIKQVDEIITKEKVIKEETTKKLDEIKANATENVNDPTLISQLEKQSDKVFAKAKEIEIKALEKFKNKLVQFNSIIINMQIPENMSLSEYIGKIITPFNNLLQEWKQIEKEVKAEMEAGAPA